MSAGLGQPKAYSADAATDALQRLERRLAALESAPASAAAPVVGAYGPRAEDATVLSIALSSGATYGANPDPRVAAASVVRPGVAVGGWERFRVERGLKLPPMLVPPFVFRAVAGNVPPNAPASSPMDVAGLVYGTLVTDIPHGLGRIPTRMRPVAPMDDLGPVGQSVVSAGGTKASGNLYLDMDFLPVFGRTPRDIALALKAMFSFAGDSASSDFQWVSIASASFYENPTLPNGVAARLVTTDKSFGGLILTTMWGLGAFQWTSDQTSSGLGSLVSRYAAAPLFKSGWATVLDEMFRCSAPLPWIGKSMSGILVDKDAPITLAALLAEGSGALLAEGSVEWEMG